MMHEHFRTFARYNQWANTKIYAVAAQLPDADYRADRGAFFKSLHGTLNHILVGDGLWLNRLTGEGAVADRLGDILHEDLDDLRRAREREDQRIIGYVDGLDDERIAAPFSYRTIFGKSYVQPLAQVLAHFFNHQTHHRGQAHALLSGLGQDAPEIDLIYFIRERNAAAAG
jgi:uncharacterized damage-inducible protein DinB